MDASIDPVNVPPDLVTKVSSTVSGFVTNQTNSALAGATVKIGTSTAITDRYGYFKIKNAMVVQEAATVEVSYNGYFKAIKTYKATEGKAPFFRIKLLQKKIIGNINAGSGGTVSMTNGVQISFPANAVKNAATGAPYSGTINVAAQYIDPTSNELNKIMPGDLRGTDLNGNMKGLTSFGMMAVELTGTSGELLQVADGKKSTLTFPVPASLNNVAPSTIPLWYFDESNGLWKEEGTATKAGNNYIGEVSHFSFWNCDIPNAIVPLTFTVVDNNNNPVTFAYVDIYPTTANTTGHIGGYTDSTGYVSVFVAPNANYSLSIHAQSICNGQVSQIFSVGTTAVDLGNIVIGTPSGTASVSGRVIDCNNHPVSNGYLIMVEADGQQTRYELDYAGSYHFSWQPCGGSMQIHFIAVNLTSGQQSEPLPFTITTGNNLVPDIRPCGINIDTYLDISINNRTFINGSGFNEAVQQTFGPLDSVVTDCYWQTFETQNSVPMPNTLSNIYMRFLSFGDPHDPASNFVYFVRPFNNILNYSMFMYPLPLYYNDLRGLPILITEYGDPGGFITGSFSGILYENQLNGGVDMTRPYDVTCSFRIKRMQ